MGLKSFEKLQEKLDYNQCRFMCYRYFIIIQYFFYKIIGLSPWTFDISEIFLENQKRNNNHIIVCRISLFGSCYNILLFLFIGLTNLYVLIDSSYTHVQSDSILTSTVRAKLKFIAILCVAFIQIIYIIRQKLIIGVFNRLESVDGKLKKCASYKTEKNNCYSYLIFMVNFFTSASLMVMVSYYYHDRSYMILFVRVSPDIIGSWVIIQYTMLLKTIYKQFTSINKSIKKLGNIKSDTDQIQILTDVKKVPLIFELDFFEIETIKYAYLELCKICEGIADFYGLPVLISIIHYVTITIIRLYFLILSLLQIRIVDNMIYLCSVIVIGSAVFLFMVLTSNVSRTTKQSRKIGITINLLMDQCAMDQKIEKQLAKFSSDILHLKVDFTACGIIPLDRTLLAMIVGTVATYLVIVVQFSFSHSPH